MKQSNKMKQKKCKQCFNMFQPDRPMMSTCSYVCAIEYAKAQKIKRDGTDKRKALKAFNDSDKNVLKRKAIQVFNAYIRARDKDKPCVSCGVIVKENMAHASHFKPANTYSYLRFDESNVHKSCSKCNVFLSGNLDQYRIRIIDRIGQKELDRLDEPNQTKNWTIEELKSIIETYKHKIKML
jgi:hypothetical protein